MAFTQKLTFKINDGHEIGLSLIYPADEHSPDKIQITIDPFQPSDPFKPSLPQGATFRWTIDADGCALLFDIGPILHDPTVNCVAECVGFALGNGLLECLWRWWRTKSRQKFEECLKEKSLGALLDAGECVAKCFGIV